MSVPAYPDYKDSGVAWLGAVPSHWDQRPLFALVRQLDDSNIGMKEDNLLSLSYGQIKRKNIEDNDGLLPASFETYQIVERDDIIWRLTDLQNDQRSLRTGIVRERGIITSAYLATRPTAISPAFLSYLLRAYDLTKVFYSMGGGLRQSMKYADVKWLPIMVPTGEEQTAIASFLDRETAKIDGLVAEQERLIALLKEKRQAVISHAVTKGLNPNAPMKDSGIEWLGQIPAHWEATTLRRCCRSVQTGGTPSSISPSEDVVGIPWFTPGDFKSLRLQGATKNTTVETIEDGECRLFPHGSVLVVSIGSTLGKVGVPSSACSTNQQINAIMPLDALSTDWLAFSLSMMSDFMKFVSNASTIGIMNQEKTKEIPIALPPVDEQEEIVSYLEQRSANFDALVAQAQSAITLLQERRAALISAAVTGKIDVRGLAVATPELETA